MLNAAVNHIANLEVVSAARFDELRKTMNGNADVLSWHMNCHCQELDTSREEVVCLTQELEEVRADKVILGARVDSMAERLCRCSETSPRVCGISSATEPIELEDEELEYVTPPMTSSPTEEEVPSLTKGPPCFRRILASDSWRISRFLLVVQSLAGELHRRGAVEGCASSWIGAWATRHMWQAV